VLQDLLNALTLGSIYLLFALGMSLAWGTIGVLNFAHGAVFMFCAFLAHLVTGHVGLPIAVLLLFGAVGGAVLSVLLQVLVFEPIQARAANPVQGELQILVGGIGVASVLLALAQRQTQSVPFGFPPDSFQVVGYTVGSVRVTNIQLIILVAAVALGVAVTLWLRTTRVGLGLRSIGVDPEIATMMGIDRRKLARGTMALAGALAGLAGILLTFYLGSIAPESGDSFLLRGFAAVVLGGVGTVSGTVLGALVLAGAETVVATQTSGQWVDVVAFGLIFVMLLVRPRGLLGRREVRRT
jgi:branched-chain amino acid transport system permease protein